MFRARHEPPLPSTGDTAGVSDQTLHRGASPRAPAMYKGPPTGPRQAARTAQRLPRPRLGQDAGSRPPWSGRQGSHLPGPSPGRPRQDPGPLHRERPSELGRQKLSWTAAGSRVGTGAGEQAGPGSTQGALQVKGRCVPAAPGHPRGAAPRSGKQGRGQRKHRPSGTPPGQSQAGQTGRPGAGDRIREGWGAEAEGPGHTLSRVIYAMTSNVALN